MNREVVCVFVRCLTVVSLTVVSLAVVYGLDKSEAERFHGFWRQLWEPGLGVAIYNNSYDDTITEISSGLSGNVV
jgi:hypothetical protein